MAVRNDEDDVFAAKLVNLLLKSGADVNAKCPDGKTAEDYAREYRKIECLQRLVSSRLSREMRQIIGNVEGAPSAGKKKSIIL